jgi:hypothetical protein
MDLGRRRGGLEIDDIRQALPVDTMTAEELADVLARLEEAGISVEIDPVMLTPRHRRTTVHDVKPAMELWQSERTATAHDRLSILASSIKAATETSSRTHGSPRRYVQKSGTIFVVAAAMILILLLALVAWHFA